MGSLISILLSVSFFAYLIAVISWVPNYGNHEELMPDQVALGKVRKINNHSGILLR